MLPKYSRFPILPQQKMLKFQDLCRSNAQSFQAFGNGFLLALRTADLGGQTAATPEIPMKEHKTVSADR
jgi:hypothetical protein